MAVEVQGMVITVVGRKIPSRSQKWFSGSILSLFENHFTLADRLATTRTGDMIRESKFRVVVTVFFSDKEQAHRTRTCDTAPEKQLVQKTPYYLNPCRALAKSS